MKRLIFLCIIGLSLSCINPAGILESTQVDIIITEIMYNRGTDTLEYIEFKNRSPGRVNIKGYYFSNGVEFKFKDDCILDKDVYFILTNSEESFKKQYPDITIAGVFSGRLSNSGECLTFCNSNSKIITEIDFKDSSFWPVAADGLGFSIVTVNEHNSCDQNDVSCWRASSRINGSPGKADPEAKQYTVLVNEIVASTISDNLDMIELYNSDTEKVDIGNWYLTDDPHDPYKYVIPHNTIIESHGFMVFNSSMFKSDFSVTITGGQIYLLSAYGGGLGGYSHGIKYEPCNNGTVFGLLKTSNGKYYCSKLKKATKGRPNGPFLPGEIVITEIMYHPRKNEAEFIEIVNRSGKMIQFFNDNAPDYSWKIDGISFKFPFNSCLDPGERMLLIDSTITAEIFREKYSVESNVKIFTYSGKLSNSGETITIEKTGNEYVDENGKIAIPYQSVDIVEYSDDYPWPQKADGDGYSLVRKSIVSWGCEPSEWKISDKIGGTPGK